MSAVYALYNLPSTMITVWLSPILLSFVLATTEARCTRSPECLEDGPVKGSCKASIHSWYYNSASGKCTEFIYGGCEGTRNNFGSCIDCKRKCCAKIVCEKLKH
uniref:Pancreatic trypsin inhibitor n=1 Tax=Rhipicephalus appendiculatus TaxID=34631 RepID=A0A131YTY8_RHIAP